MTRATNYSMDLNELHNGEPIAELKLDIHCPQVGGDPTRINWSLEQCELRVRVNNPCTISCAHGKRVKAALEARGAPYKLPNFEGIVVGEKTKGKAKRENPDNKWPGKNKRRNMAMTIDFLNGGKVDEMEDRYYINRNAIRKLVYAYCEVANEEVSKAFPAGGNRVKYLRSKAKLLLPFLFLANDTEDPLKGA